MKICHYNDNQAGAVIGERVHPIGAALVAAGHLKPGYSMLEVIDALANRPGAMQCARDALRSSASVPLGSVRLLAPILNPPSLWAAAANYKAHQAEMLAKSGGADRSQLGKDDLMAEFFLKPTSSIIGPGDTIVIPRISNHVDFEAELCAVIGKRARRVSEEHAGTSASAIPGGATARTRATSARASTPLPRSGRGSSRRTSCPSRRARASTSS